MEIKIKNLSKTYPNGVKALSNINLTIRQGMFGLLGPNGAGKSTLMRTIAALQEPDSGSIFLDDLNILDDKMAVRRVLGYLPQEFGVYPRVKTEELLKHLAILKGIVNKGERKDMIDALLQKTNLWEYRKRYVSTFSGGMKQRFGIAQALLGEPLLIIVDEPTAGLDPGALFYSIAILKKSQTFAFASTIFLLFAYAFSTMLIQNIEMQNLAYFFDPFGLEAAVLTTKYWTIFEKNTTMVSISGWMLLNRMIWMAASVGILALLYYFFSFSTPKVKGTRKKIKEEPTASTLKMSF